MGDTGRCPSRVLGRFGFFGWFLFYASRSPSASGSYVKRGSNCKLPEAIPSVPVFYLWSCISYFVLQHKTSEQKASLTLRRASIVLAEQGLLYLIHQEPG